MNLTVVVPDRVIVRESVRKVVAEGRTGCFCLLPRHIDYLASLVPGILTFVRKPGGEGHLAVNGGTLVKRGADVRVSTRQAVAADDLERLRREVQSEFQRLDERERRTQTALASLQASFVEKTLEVEKRG